MTLVMSGANLNRMIKQSSMKKVQVAAAKGITPQSLSRHISGLHKLTLKDAEEYAAILQCNVKDIVQDRNPIELFGIMDDDYMNDHKGSIMVRDASQAKVFIYNALDLPDDYTCVRRDLTVSNRYLNGTLSFFSNMNIQASRVCPSIHSKKSIVKMKDGRIWICVPWENADGTYRLQAIFTNNMSESTQLIWATRITLEVIAPKSLGFVEL